jgi:hypothetical protein
MGKTARDAVMDTWEKLLNRQPGGHDMPPQDRGRDMDMER